MTAYEGIKVMNRWLNELSSLSDKTVPNTLNLQPNINMNIDRNE